MSKYTQCFVIQIESEGVQHPNKGVAASTLHCGYQDSKSMYEHAKFYKAFIPSSLLLSC